MNALIVAVGSAGDTLPFVHLAKQLASRGHGVTMFGNGHYRSIAEREGVPFEELLSSEEHLNRVRDRTSLSTLQHLRYGLHKIGDDVRPVYEVLKGRIEPDNTFLVAQGLMLGARVAAAEFGVPLVTVHLQPACFAERGPRGFVRRTVTRLADRPLAQPLNTLLREAGLPPAKRILVDWWHSPDLVLGLFPRWFAPDVVLPDRAVLAGFPQYDSPPPEAEQADSPYRGKLVFSQSSAVSYPPNYFLDCIDIVGELGRQAIILAPDRELLPARLPDYVEHFPYLNHSEVLPYAAVHVHHGGIGTVAQSLAAGVPQLVTPRIADQPQNARLVKRLGVGDSILPFRLTRRIIAAKLRRLLSSQEVRARCRECRELCRDVNAFDQACDAIDDLLVRRSA